MRTGGEKATATAPSLDPAALLGAMIAFRDRMLAREDEVNGLNVFPVPDGDTGTNVLLTLEAALAAVDPALAIHDPDGNRPTLRGPVATVTGQEAGLADLCQTLTRGIILGARGSSGVILSQAVAAVLRTITTTTGPPGQVLAAALERARAAAYAAVAQPVEGTILTVLSASAAAASAAADLPLPDLTELVAVEARAAVARTPTLLPALARAGVVDSGGRALSYGFDALAEVAGGRPVPLPPPAGHAVLTPADAADVSPAPPAEQPPEGGGRYEVVASLRTDESGAGLLRDRWRSMGDAVVVSGADGIWRGHVHSDDPEQVLAAARELLGDTAVEGVTRTDLHAQIAAREPTPPPVHADGSPRPRPASAGLRVVAVVEGAGLVRAYTELGAEVVDADAASPSVRDLLDAIEGSPAGEVVVLPNHSTVVPAAAQAGQLASKPVHILPARHPLAGLAALIAFDPAADRAANLTAMRAALQRTRAGRVAPVVREAVGAVGPVRPGQWLAISGREAVGVGSTPVEAALALADHLLTPRTEVVTVAWGPAVTEEQVAQLRAELSRRSPGAVVDALDAGHHDAFLISAEEMPDEEGTVP